MLRKKYKKAQEKNKLALKSRHNKWKCNYNLKFVLFAIVNICFRCFNAINLIQLYVQAKEFGNGSLSLCIICYLLSACKHRRQRLVSATMWHIGTLKRMKRLADGENTTIHSMRSFEWKNYSAWAFTVTFVKAFAVGTQFSMTFIILYANVDRLILSCFCFFVIVFCFLFCFFRFFGFVGFMFRFCASFSLFLSFLSSVWFLF